MDQQNDRLKQLDLSAFPKIVQPQTEEEINKRSQGLKDIRAAMENLMSIMEAYFATLLDIDVQHKLLEKQQYALKQQFYDLSKEEQRVAVEKQSVKEQEEYVNKANISLKEKEAASLENKNYLREIEDAKLQYESIKSETLSQQAIVDQKLKYLETLNVKQTEIEEKEALIERSAAIDAERKRLLDVREERIKAKELQLAIDSRE